MKTTIFHAKITVFDGKTGVFIHNAMDNHYFSMRTFTVFDGKTMIFEGNIPVFDVKTTILMGKPTSF